MKLEQLDLDSVETVVDEKVEDKVMSRLLKLGEVSLLLSLTTLLLMIYQVTGLKMTRHQKRKIDETHVEVSLIWPFLSWFFDIGSFLQMGTGKEEGTAGQRVSIDTLLS